MHLSTFSGMGILLSPTLLSSACSNQNTTMHSKAFRTLIFDLLKNWCDGMINTQIINPDDPKTHGLLECPACDIIHARVMDAVYPFFYMAKATGNKKYLNAGIAAFEWGENVTRADGAWTNELDPKSWDGTTVFGAVALAETLHYHGDLLDENRRNTWYKRLEKAADFVYHRFDRIGNANINYGATTIYALYLIGKVLNKAEYVKRAKILAEQIKSHFTLPNYFIYGEKQGRDKSIRSPKGLLGIDLGYNAEESLNGLVLYALAVKDEALLELVKKSLDTHLEFITPDGGLDNGFGNRMYKWSYWGSRTSDGMQPAFGMMADYNPALGTAAFKNTELLKRCTSNGLLHGGLHYLSHGIKPCVHHTFAHAKPLATMLDHWEHLPEINKTTPLPREIADGIKHFNELDVSLFARGNWRGTISAYDAEYNPKDDCRQATGGALSILYHNKVGLLCTASMAAYKLKEANNQQPAPGKDIALTPRIELYRGNKWYTNLFDLEATFTSSDKKGKIEFLAKTQLKNENREAIKNTASTFEINYRCTSNEMQIHVKTTEKITEHTAFILPIVSPTGEKTIQPKANELTIQKPEGFVHIIADAPLEIINTAKPRTFNMVPGVEAIPIRVSFPKGERQIQIRMVVDA